MYTNGDGEVFRVWRRNKMPFVQVSVFSVVCWREFVAAGILESLQAQAGTPERQGATQGRQS